MNDAAAVQQILRGIELFQADMRLVRADIQRLDRKLTIS